MKNKKYIILILFTVALLLGIAGITFAFGGNGERGIRIQDRNSFIANRKDLIIISDPHYATIPFYLYLFVTSPSQKSQENLLETTTFKLTILGPNNESIPLDDVTITPSGNNFAVSSPIRVIIPYSGIWKLKITTTNLKFVNGHNIDIPILNAPISSDPNNPIILPPPNLRVDITPTNPTVQVNDTVQFTAKLINVDTQPESVITTQASDWVWISSNSSIAKAIPPPGSFMGITPGTIGITASFKPTSDVLATNSTNLTVLGGEPHHLAVVPFNSTGPAVPTLNIRSDKGPSTSTWGYIGEPMTINVALQVQDVNSDPADYTWDTSWFNNAAHWGITFTSNSGVLDPTLYTVEGFNVNLGSDSSVLQATFTITPTPDRNLITQNEFDNFQIMINPYFVYNGTNIKLTTSPARAMALNESGVQQTGPNNLYRGRIRVADNYFYSSTGSVNVYVERYHHSDAGTDIYITNTDDSSSEVAQLGLYHDTNFLIPDQTITPTQTNKNGVLQFWAENSTDYTVKYASPPNDSVSNYFLIQYGTLTWGQIIKNVPPDTKKEFTVWETEQ